MEVEDIHVSKRSRMGNGDGGANAVSGSVAAATRVAQEQRQLQDEDEEDGEGRSLMLRGGGGCTAAGVRVALRQWNQSTASRIYRVSRASGGKDRHSKVMTAKGLRDRRVRLSVSTAIQFYDLQDRLGYDQPSKAIEWLIKAAATAIADLPPLDGAFSDQRPPVRQPVDDEKPAGAADEEDEEDADVSQLQYTDHHHHLQHQREEHQPQQRQQQQRFSLTKSTCSSTSETSKGSVLSLSRSEIRVKARERARERTATAKDKEKDKDDMEDDAHVVSAAHHQGMNPNPVSQSSFTELLTGGGHQNHGGVTIAQANHPATSFVHKQLRQLPTSATAATTTDYFGQVGLLGTGQKPHQPTIFPTQTHFGGNSSPMGMVPFNFAAVAAAAGDHPAEMQQQQYMQEHLIPFAVTAAGGDYINFSISSGFNRGTLQSNSPSPLLHHHLQMFSSPVDGSNLPFFLGAAAQATSASGEGQMPAGFDSRLHLCYRHPDLKGKGKN